ncbi:hypothetical protein JHK82_018258 [Glycine max]|uniref:Vesicle-associated membrane protein 722 n=1 Tax=Glycine soja TaxID=3848 RepID=A0A0B2RJ34_GLYSO|nr:hypothetical protein JHK87_018148 [Glycine soja]KAG5022338.1 hypothetical protein JHK85_018680 [Glycine max]KAG5142563.1 hypothetical protein JHK82_018258 [Glycine max]KHN31822.1 Vesicle-associated membrane protein 722 [Glycine soja]
MGFLERVKDEFVSKYGGGKTALLLPKLRERMQYYVDHPQEISKLAKELLVFYKPQGIHVVEQDRLLYLTNCRFKLHSMSA